MCQGLVVVSLIPAIQLPQLASGQAVNSIGQANTSGEPLTLSPEAVAHRLQLVHQGEL